MIGRSGVLLRRVVQVRDEEVAVLLWSCACSFLLLAGWYVLRPLREEMGIAGGVKNLPWMFTGTLLATFAASPLFSLLVTRYSRRRFIPFAYHFFAANLVLYFILFRWLEGEGRVGVARVFYVWTSVFNLFVVSVLWGYMADVFVSEQAKRLFGFIGAGGTVGAIAGASLTTVAVKSVGTEGMLLAAALLVELCVLVFMRLERLAPALPRSVASRPPMPGPPALERAAAGAADPPPVTQADRTGVWGGLTLVARSPYLLAIAFSMILFTISSTFAYLEQARIVQASSVSAEARTAIFARIDLMVNVLTLLMQALLTGRIIGAIGLGPTQSILPGISITGFAALAASPVLGVLMAFQVLRRAGDYAAAKPAREVLYTVVRREEKYKAKSFIDTFVYRSGDAIGAWGYKVITASGDPGRRVLFASVPLTALWIALCLLLGRQQKRMAGEGLPPRS